MGYYGIDQNSDELEHHGVLGQKWGIRRYQNKDGSLTPAGVKRAKQDFADRRTRFKDSEGSEYYVGYKTKKPTEEVKTSDGKMSRYQSTTLREKNNQLATYTIDKKLNAIVAKTIEANGKTKIVDLDDSDIAKGKKLIDELDAKQSKQWDKEIGKALSDSKKNLNNQADLQNQMNTQNQINEMNNLVNMQTQMNIANQMSQTAARDSINEGLMTASLGATGGVTPYAFGMV